MDLTLNGEIHIYLFFTIVHSYINKIKSLSRINPINMNSLI